MGTKNRFKLSSVVYTMSCVSPGRSSPRLCCLSRAVFVCLFLSFHRSCSEICCHVTPEFLCSRTVQYIITEPLFFLDLANESVIYKLQALSKSIFTGVCLQTARGMTTFVLLKKLVVAL